MSNRRYVTTAKGKVLQVIERKLGREKAVGQAFTFEPGSGVVEIDPRQAAREYLDTLVHEMLHIEFPDLEEDRVAACSRRLSAALWKQNYRRIHA